MGVLTAYNITHIWANKSKTEIPCMQLRCTDLRSDTHFANYSTMQTRYIHTFYVQLNECTLMGVSYKFVQNEQSTSVIYGACIIRYERKASPPKSQIRQTAKERLLKCPVGVLIGLAEITPHARRHVIRECIHLFGVRGLRLK
jgi:hypothetical protein